MGTPIVNISRLGVPMDSEYLLNWVFIAGFSVPLLNGVTLKSSSYASLDTWPHQLTRFCLYNLQKNVEGENCDRCKPGFYNLQEGDPHGCSECFCFGVSDVCDGLTWSVSQVGNFELGNKCVLEALCGRVRKPGGRLSLTHSLPFGETKAPPS